MGVSHALEIGAGAGGGQRVEWRPRRTRFLDCLWTVTTEQRDGWCTRNVRRRRGRTNLGMSLLG